MPSATIRLRPAPASPYAGILLSYDKFDLRPRTAKEDFTLGPLFILGFPRSGTTAMASALSLTGAFGTYSTEGHFLYLFSNGIEKIASDKLNPSSIIRAEPERRRFLKEFTAMVNKVFSPTNDPADVRWIDKTPGMAQVNAIPAIVTLWPQSRFIYLYRGPHDAVRSNLANWPEQLAGKEAVAAERWAQCQRAWRKQRQAIPKDHFVQMFQPDMRAKPHASAQALKPLLNFSDDQVETIGRFWAANKSVNRPVAGQAGRDYDEVVLSARQTDEVSRVTDDESQHWPRLRQRSAA